MILGIGCDLLDIRRIEKTHARYGERLIQRLLSKSEQEVAQQNPSMLLPSSLAKRFAAKEACAKACGTGIGKHLSFQDITVLHGLRAPPKLFLSTDSIQRIWGKKVELSEIKIDLSLSDEYPYVQAFVIFSRI